ncbi:MAG TPA: 2OG-Fe(II) oxygenase [Xanthomonadaceae bacterium]|nr:2OG-Fe(II) oxygenase [Xanthomonadaceae bacterium]
MTQLDVPALTRSAEAGSPAAALALARHWLQADDNAAALEWYQRSAESGLVAAQSEFGRLLIFGVAEHIDVAAGVAWLRRAEGAGDATAPYVLAMLALGEPQPDPGTIGRRLLASARLGHPPALRSLALHLGRYGTATDAARATALLESAAAAGDRTSSALYAHRLAAGIGQAPDRVRAQAIVRQLAAGGLQVTLPEPSDTEPVAFAGDPVPWSIDLAPALKLADAPRTLHEAPLVRVAENVLGDEECRFLRHYGAPLVRPSLAVDPVSGQSVRLDYRNSRDIAIDPLFDDVTLRLLQHRMAALAGLPLANAEPMVLLNYRPGEEYRPHADYLPAGRFTAVADGGTGQRCATVIVYAGAVEAGGATRFLELDLEVEPAPGRAVHFQNLKPDGSPEPRSRHAGLPVVRGEKWIASLWFREGRHRAV